MKYADYLASDRWQTVRHSALERANHRCQLCGTNGELQVHHNTYENIGDEQDRDLLVLCDGCHTRNSHVMIPLPTMMPSRTMFLEWYPDGRAGEIIKSLETETDWSVVRALLAEKMSLDRDRV